jgi:gluconokinase
MSACVLVVMGVSGSGKSTVGARLAQRLGWDFAEGDDFHPAANVAKMAAGQPLTDADREPWLAAIAAWIDAELEAGRRGVITCSALKRGYRDRLRRADVRFVYLRVARGELERRLTSRPGHFMPARLLDSQLAVLEPPAADEAALTVDADEPEQSVESIIAALKSSAALG